MSHSKFYQPSNAFIMASWCALVISSLTYLIGLWNAPMQLNEKGYYLVILMYGLFSAVSLQKTVRDKAEHIPTTSLYLGLSWLSLASAILLLIIGLLNASLPASEKGFYGMAFAFSLFSAITVQKNTRDLQEAQSNMQTHHMIHKS